MEENDNKMNPYLLAFITGLTTGGLSCLAVQGGLLASSLEKQLEIDIAQNQIRHPRSSKKKLSTQLRSRMALPILLFLFAKVVAYTILGYIIGALGSVLQLTSGVRAVFLLFVGLFMLGNALRMLNVHPIFRYFVIEPPKWITRFIRRTSKGEELFTPLFLGALTVLIPCGVTQAMLAVALGTGNPNQAAGMMFAFTIGTTPVFFAVSYLATELGSRMQSVFMRIVAIVILFLGLVSLDSGATLLGAPSVMGFAQSIMNPVDTSAKTGLTSSDGVLLLNATNDGYSPQILHAKANQPAKLNMVTKNTFSCARGFVIPTLGVEELLPETGTVVIDIPAQVKNTVINFTCSMGMYTGKIIFDLE
jgi:sulfite exporter TauE/SafE